MNVLFSAVHEVRSWHTASFRCAAEFGRYRGIADIEQTTAIVLCSKCGIRNSETYHPIWARPDARVSGATGQYPDYSKC